MAEWICVGYTTVWSGIYECSIPYLTAGVGVSYDPLSKGRIFCFFNGFLDIVVFFVYKYALKSYSYHFFVII